MISTEGYNIKVLDIDNNDCQQLFPYKNMKIIDNCEIA